MRRLPGFLLVLAAGASTLLSAGCSAYDAPSPETLARIRLAPASRPAVVRHRVHLSLDSRWLAGEFDGVVVSEPGAARIQLFGDVGPKMIDLLARPDRMTGYFPQTREGVDVVLPDRAVPHPLLFLGATLLEDLSEVDADRILGVQESDEGWWLDLKPVIPGMRCEELRGPDGLSRERRFKWMYGVKWRERWEGAELCTIEAPGVTIRVRILGRDTVEPRPSKAFEIELPGDVRVVR